MRCRFPRPGGAVSTLKRQFLCVLAALNMAQEVLPRAEPFMAAPRNTAVHDISLVTTSAARSVIDPFCLGVKYGIRAAIIQHRGWMPHGVIHVQSEGKNRAARLSSSILTCFQPRKGTQNGL
ncbi:hypothetical protein B0H63DRAFT_487327 [Podospora didyma]|uniref:Uncharacterized protein n=1 Tax=Podospora didyma TaxID=330526 RepID=A0AAE0K5V5_9PEZI|nr:hypothetical protein B0H63DRAFT_487327 [Podospora didyma]